MEKKTQAFLSFLLNSTNDHRKRLSSRICGARALHKTTTRGSSSLQKRTSFCTRRKRGREKEMRFQRSLAVVFPRIRNKFQSQASRYFSSQLESEQRFVWSILKSFVNFVLYTNNNGIKRKLFWKIRWLQFIGPLLESRLISMGLFFVAEIPLVALLKLCVDYTEILVRYAYTNTCIYFTHCAFISAASNYDYCLLLCRKLECSFFVLDKRWVIWIIYSLLSSTSLKKNQGKMHALMARWPCFCVF